MIVVLKSDLAISCSLSASLRVAARFKSWISAGHDLSAWGDMSDLYQHVSVS